MRHFLQDTVAAFRERFPDVALELVTNRSTSRCLQAVRRERADLALVTIGEPVRGIEHRPVAELSFRLVVPSGDPLAARETIEPQELRGIRYIGLTPGRTSRGYIHRALEAEGVTLESTMTVDDFDTASLFVELGLGHTIVPAVHAWNFAKSDQVASVGIERLDAVPIGWATRRWSSLSRVALAFVTIFRDNLRGLGPVPGLQIVGDQPQSPIE